MSATGSSTFQPPPPPALWSLQSARCHMMIMLGCVSMTLGMIRGSIGVVMVCMKIIAEAPPRPQNETNRRGALTVLQILQNPSLPSISWTIDQQAFVHAGFYLGSVLVILPSHHLIKRYRAKRILTCGLLFCGIGSLLTPLAAFSSSHWLFAIVRIISGIGNGEHIGIFCSLVFTPLLCQIKLLGGWPIASEMYGLAALGVLVIWELRAAHKPRHSSYVTAFELEYIRSRRLKRSNFRNVSLQLPLKQLLLSPCVIAICLCCFTHSLINSGLVAYLPMFNHLALHMGLQQNAFASGAPIFLQTIAEISFYFSVTLMQWRGISTTAAIKFLASIATCGAASCFLSIALLKGTENMAIIALIALGIGMMSAYSVGYRKCATVVAPQFVQFVLLYLYMCSQLAGVVSPILIAVLISKEIERKFFICLVVVFILGTGIIYLIFAHGRREVHVSFYRDVASTSARGVMGGEGRVEEELVRGGQFVPAASSRSPVVVTYHEGEVNISLRPAESFEDDFTSDDDDF